MTRLAIRALGPFQASLDGEALSGFASDKVRALLAYLAPSPDLPHRREALAGLLWPEFPERSARTNLRNALANLRRVIRDDAASPPFLLSTRQTIQFNGQSDYWLDTDAFENLLALLPPTSVQLEQAVSLARGMFLEGFTLGDAAPFEEWQLLRREYFCRQVVEALDSLVGIYEAAGAYELALAHARRRSEREPWQESGQRQLMRLLANSGHRSEALAQYERFRELLLKELGVEPSAATKRLYRELREGELEDPVQARTPLPAPAGELPPFLDEEVAEVQRPVFVGRERELVQLEGCMEAALAGQGGVVFVTGEAGSGKTALVQEFARCAQDTHSDLLAASGSCNAYTGIGDPYLPFREILELLAGGVDAAWASGVMTGRHARRLWQALPAAVEALVEAGPDLIDTFVPRAALLQRLSAYAEWTGETDWISNLCGPLLGHAQPADSGMAAIPPQPSHLFRQITGVVNALALRAPLLLVLDDLQWADAGSVSLLFHLGRQLGGSRVLVIGTFRPEDVALGRDGSRHPLEAVVHELQRESGEAALDMDGAGSQAFVEAMLDSEPNRLGARFREKLYGQTRGHPLFAAELLRGLQEAGGLVQDTAGRWLEGSDLDWDRLPVRVDAVIAERVTRLPKHLQAALQVASVEGEAFTAEVLARVRGASEEEVVSYLSGDLDRRHRLVRAQGAPSLDGRRRSRYRFRHILLQKYVYDNLDKVERAYLHKAVGTALEALHESQTEGRAEPEATKSIAVQLAWHFQEAGIVDKAIQYLYQAGERAVQLSAFDEGIPHLTRGLALLMALPDSGDADRRVESARQELALQLALGIGWRGTQGYGPPEAERAYSRARELCQQLGETSQLCLVLGKLSILHFVRAEHQKARVFAQEALSLAQMAGDPLHTALGHWYLGTVLLYQGDYRAARAHLENMIAYYEPQQHRSLVLLRGSDAGLCALAHHACCLWCLGLPEQALKRSREALALARELGHGVSLVEVLYFAGCLFNVMRRDGQALRDDAEELVRLSGQAALLGFLREGVSFRGEALVLLGQVQEGMAQLYEGMAVFRSHGGKRFLPGRLCSLAEAQAKAGLPEEGLTTVAEALAVAEEVGEHHWEAELNRLKGELLFLQRDEAGAEISFQKAVEVARRQCAKSWELRAATSLARLWQAQDLTHEARQLLLPIYGWFTEGFSTPDLVEARSLLAELG